MYWVSFLTADSNFRMASAVIDGAGYSNFRIASAVIDGAGYGGGKFSWSGNCPGVGKRNIRENTLKSIPFQIFSLVLQFHSEFHSQKYNKYTHILTYSWN